MEVILLNEVHNLGHPGEIVKVKSGYARNYLIPNKLAVKKTLTSLKILEKQKDEFEKRKAERNAEYEKMIDAITEIGELEIKVKTGEGEKLFGTVTNHHVADALIEKGIGIDKKQIVIKDTVKTLGSYPALIQLSKDHKTELTFNVVDENA